MAYPEVIIPPSVKPESPCEPSLMDEQTTDFRPRFGRGTTQRQVWADPTWGWKVRFRGLASADRALVRAAILGARGKAANIRMTPGLPLRGSFPATELLTNNDFSNGTTGWTIGNAVLSISDRVARLTYNGGAGSQPFFYQAVAGTQYAPYALRGMMADSPQTVGLSVGPSLTYGSASAQAYNATRGLRTVSAVLDSGSAQNQFPVAFSSNSGFSAGAYIDCAWSSLSRCALVDNGPNALTYSDQIDNAAWTKTGVTVTGNYYAAPDGTVTADRVIEDTSTGEHYVVQAASKSAVAQDWCLCVALSKGDVTSLRDRAQLRVVGPGGTDGGVALFDLSAGSVVSTTTAGGGTNSRSFMVSMGNGWFMCALVVRVPSSVTTVQAVVNLVENPTTTTYTGTSSRNIGMWRATLAQSSLPVRLTQTTTTATTGTAQSGGQLYVKGLPVSTSGLLLAGDFFEINGELKQCTASLDSDAAGLGVLSFRPGLWAPVADNDPVIILNPMGRFSLASNPRIVENYGQYTDFELDLVEAGP